MRWGLVPFWAKTQKGKPLINARVETAATKPAFRNSFKSRRCLIPVTGFYEWTSEMGKKQPYLFSGDERFLVFAGLHAKWRDPENDRVLRSCVILTTKAQGESERYHDRMPLALPSECFEDWVCPDTPPERLMEILGNPVPPQQVTRVGMRVNHVKNDDPECCRPLDPPTTKGRGQKSVVEEGR